MMVDDATLSEAQRAELEKLFDYVIEAASRGNADFSSAYVGNVQAVLDGKSITYEEDEDEEEDDGEEFLRKMEQAADEAAAGLPFGGSE